MAIWGEMEGERREKEIHLYARTRTRTRVRLRRKRERERPVCAHTRSSRAERRRSAAVVTRPFTYHYPRRFPDNVVAIDAIIFLRFRQGFYSMTINVRRAVTTRYSRESRARAIHTRRLLTQILTIPECAIFPSFLFYPFLLNSFLPLCVSIVCLG